MEKKDNFKKNSLLMGLGMFGFGVGKIATGNPCPMCVIAGVTGLKFLKDGL